jgi:hypothetical protein
LGEEKDPGWAQMLVNAIQFQELNEAECQKSESWIPG